MTDPSSDDAPLPRDLRFLKTLVTVLTAVMIMGVITIVALLVIRLNAMPQAMLVAPENFAVPEGVGVHGYSVVGDRTVVITDDGMIRVFDSVTRVLVQTIPLPQ